MSLFVAECSPNLWKYIFFTLKLSISIHLYVTKLLNESSLSRRSFRISVITFEALIVLNYSNAPHSNYEWHCHAWIGRCINIVVLLMKYNFCLWLLVLFKSLKVTEILRKSIPCLNWHKQGILSSICIKQKFYYIDSEY